MATFIVCEVTWEDTSSGDRDELGHEIQIYTDSPSFVPNIPVDYSAAAHPWMQLRPIAAGETSAQFQLQTPVTFVTFRVRQYNATGPGEWTAVAGTRVSITQPSGALVPTAPINPGLAVVDG